MKPLPENITLVERLLALTGREREEARLSLSQHLEVQRADPKQPVDPLYAHICATMVYTDNCENILPVDLYISSMPVKKGPVYNT